MTAILDRAPLIDENFKTLVLSKNFPVPRSTTSLDEAQLSKELFLSLFNAQLQSRHLDLIARELKQKNLGFYTIGSSGHEGNAAIAAAFRTNDPALLHYRSGAFFLMRANLAGEQEYLYTQLLALVAAKNEPIASGRHKVFGSVSLNIPPQTSTIASHLPRAVGLAVATTRAKEIGSKQTTRFPFDGVTICSFGDASFHHSTAQGALNAARYHVFNHYPLPLVLLCEDNGIGISVATPSAWIATNMANDFAFHYLYCDGLNLADVYKTAKIAEHIARTKREPVFIHMKTIRLMGHAGSDIESQYLSIEAITANEFQDPLLHTAQIAIAEGILQADQIVERYECIREEIKQLCQKVLKESRLSSSQEVMSSIIPPPKKISSPILPSESERKHIWGESYEQLQQPKNLSQSINLALTDLMLQYPSILLFGEDVARKGGVYRVTADLMERFGQRRVFDAILDEQTILGHALGFALNGFLPIPEIQFLAYIHNAIDQLRGEAATQSFFSNGTFTNPMIIRIPGLAYQKGFGGHFHNDNSIAALRDIPGIIIACPSRGADAAKMLRTCVELAYIEQRVIIFLEPIALYMTRDLHHPQDQLWLDPYPALADKITLDDLGVSGSSEEFAIISYGNGFYLSSQAQEILKKEHHLTIKVIDLRWLKPLPIASLIHELQSCKKILIVDEGRKTGSVSEELFTLLHEHLNHSCSQQFMIERLTGEDSFIPLGTAWKHVLPSCDEIVQRVLKMLQPPSLV